jgi:hypothetical protein
MGAGSRTLGTLLPVGASNLWLAISANSENANVHWGADGRTLPMSYRMCLTADID